MNSITPQEAPYEAQLHSIIGTRRTYPVRVTPCPPRTWCLQAQSQKYRPYLFYWAMTTVKDETNATGESTWTLWFGFPEPPMENLERVYHDGIVSFLAEDSAPHFLFVPDFRFDLFVGPDGTIGVGQILHPEQKSNKSGEGTA